MLSSAEDNSQPRESKEHQILQDNKDDLVSQVASVKLVEFSAELSRSMVVSKKVNEVFAALDDTVNPKLGLRYLLQQVCEGVIRDVTIFQRFIKVLSGYGGGMKKLATRLTAELYESESGPCYERGVVGTEIFLSKDDVAELMETLVEVSDKWDILGTALGLPQHTISECSRCRSNAASMINILHEWISHGPLENITLDQLRCALHCELVGRYTVAQTLEKRFRVSHKPSVTKPVVGITTDLDSTLRIVYLSSDTEVADGKSIVLEAQASESEGVCHQRMKDGQALSDNLAYSATHSSILAISPVSQGNEGKYTCRIMKGSEQVVSEAVFLTVSFPPEKKHLLRLYSKNAEVPRDSWPPKVANTFINLALITKKKEVTDEYQSSVRGDIDDIIVTKEKIEFAAVFGEYDSGALVLIEGRPGSGKTTLVHKATRDWATGGQVLKNAKLVFLIPLRSFSNSTTEKLSDILELIYQNPQNCEKVTMDIEETNGEGVCFVIDGLDEFHPNDETKSVIHRLLYEQYLPAAMVIISSRPVATGKLRRATHVTRRVEVLGFSQQQVFEYIDNFPFTSDNSPSQLKAYLHSNSNLLHMCYLPVHVGMICFLYEHEKGIPLTETEIYENFTRFIVLRNLRRCNEKADLGSLKDLCGREKEYFSSICHLAFNMTLQSTQTVNQRDTRVPFSLGIGPNDAPSLGLVTIDRTAGLHKLHDTYAFLHLTLQEYLAALYLAQLKNKKQKKLMKLYAGEKQMRLMWKFYCSIVKSKNMVAKIQHIMWPADKKRPKDDSLYQLHFAFVSQQCVLCDKFVEERTGVLKFTDCILTPIDMTALAYVISTTSHTVTNLVIGGCNLHADHVRTLVREVSHKKLMCLQTLHLYDNNIGAGGAAALAEELRYCNNLLSLDLRWNHIGNDGATALAEALKCCINLQTLDLGRNYIGGSGAASLAESLKCCNNLHTLDLRGNCIGDNGTAALGEALKCCNNLQMLDLEGNNIGDDGVAALAETLKCCNNLHALDLRWNNIGDDGVALLAEGLKCCNNLQTLDLRENKIGAKGRSGTLAHLKRRIPNCIY